ncbi:TIGR01777 family oxidoreductase [Rouxiella badensis]|uniref:TIGR01777 family oxidoreductase n=1 Tax=Rouxiella badensis TaxID=1646377 RepID=UPI001D14E80D|nr:TIGR01777 family oxidoreductase [Rouxiella badensis]MCC3721151.1 TIGR01777 family oxidoreductase [Rouxiella badensis]MCC3730954.1 TIGR01777 family oxidoreductase [Rouxiella badensis]MCC3734627.1 TIGR01777 family oxidoreductase [Rouxiella badensis]MCC3742388.1 TIGR01777 family oxidoreductase [Rouxiella badensis]MCC3760100.1 TIGR01777 family oxidoreductase [Rouxiella badensis]
MKILITGASGLIGRRLTETLLSQSHQVTALTRAPERAAKLLGPQVQLWNTLADKTSLDGFDAVINLAGEPIADKRWTKDQKQKLCDSRWQLTEKLAALINASTNPPSVFISGSAVGYYGDQGQAVVAEDEPPNKQFTWQLCARWEALALAAESERTRVCLLRTGVVLSQKGGALSKMVLPFRAGLGGPFGDGQQYMPWIHIDDMVNAILFLLYHETLNGAFNLVSPYPVRNDQFSALLGEILHRPSFMRVPASVVRLLMGESAILVLGGQRAIPQRLEDAGFEFRYTELKPALEDVLEK